MVREYSRPVTLKVALIGQRQYCMVSASIKKVATRWRTKLEKRLFYLLLVYPMISCKGDGNYLLPKGSRVDLSWSNNKIKQEKAYRIFTKKSNNRKNISKFVMQTTLVLTIRKTMIQKNCSFPNLL